jgi:hypothetical protein
MRRVCTLTAAVFAIALMTISPAAFAGTVWDGTADTSWYVGHETASEYELSTAEQLAGLAQLVNGGNAFAGKKVTLAGDIDLGGEGGGHSWTPIGTYIPRNSKPFNGTFDGKGHSISGLYINEPNENNQGFFGTVQGKRIKLRRVIARYNHCPIRLLNVYLENLFSRYFPS